MKISSTACLMCYMPLNKQAVNENKSLYYSGLEVQYQKYLITKYNVENHVGKSKVVEGVVNFI